MHGRFGFEPHTEIIRKGKASKPTGFGKLVEVQEAENQIITNYRVFAERPSDQHLLVPAVEEHQRRFGRVPRLVAANASFYSQANEKNVKEMGVSWIAILNRSTHSAERRTLAEATLVPRGSKMADRERRPHQRVETRHGLNRCRYRGLPGMERWVGLDVINNLIQIGTHLALQSE